MKFTAEPDKCVDGAQFVCGWWTWSHDRQYSYYLHIGTGILEHGGRTVHGRTNRAAPRARYAELASQVADIGFIMAGSVTHRYTRCTSPGCRCNAEPPRPHGPYYQWTAKIGGKTVTRRLTPTEADLYQQWITNDRQLRAIIANMREIAEQATNLIINTTPTNQNQV